MTQAIADFLSSQCSPSIDGIIYPSVQVAGQAKNIVLFHKASVVEKVAIPEGTKFSVSTLQDYEGGPEVEYSVSEEVPPAGEVQASARANVSGNATRGEHGS